jgi:CDP-glycerol glycerophosphotransferase
MDLKRRISEFNYIIYDSVHTFIHHRDSNVILIGSWMGTKFADNSRFLYQYLYENKHSLGLKKVIWVTRNPEVNKELNKLGYESYMIGSKDSNYWHLKAGIHIICNQHEEIPSMNLLPDIDTKYSYGAKKVNLWHGVGMKSIGATSNADKRQSNISAKVNWRRKHRFITSLITCGGWSEAFFLCTSKINARVNYNNSGQPEDRMFISAYPRNCKCLQLLPEEEKIINQVKQYKGAILYLPTFRDKKSGYVHPLESVLLCNFIKESGWVWIEKPHTADSERSKFKKRTCPMIELDSNFDVNVLYDHIDCVLSDYSSAAFDGAYRGLPTILYTPDIEQYKNGSGGLLPNFEEYLEPLICKTEDTLFKNISEVINRTYLTKERKSTLYKIRKDYFDDRDSSYEIIWNDILRVIGLKKQ